MNTLSILASHRFTSLLAKLKATNSSFVQSSEYLITQADVLKLKQEQKLAAKSAPQQFSSTTLLYNLDTDISISDVDSALLETMNAQHQLLISVLFPKPARELKQRDPPSAADSEGTQSQVCFCCLHFIFQSFSSVLSDCRSSR
jgi:hypothetical protein